MEERVQQLNEKPVRPDAEYVLYWAQMNRRAAVNHGFQYAVALANRLRLPVLVYEGLTCSYPHANDRLHTFILEGIPSNAANFRAAGAGYLFHLRRRQSDPNDALLKVATRAAAVVTDDYPVFVTRKWNPSLAAKVGVAAYAVDSSCVVPMSRMTKREYAAYTIRPKIQKLLPQYLAPLAEVRPHRSWDQPQPWPELHTEVERTAIPGLVASCEINHTIAPSTAFRGGSAEAQRRLSEFLERRLARYASGRNEPSEHATSNMSPYLHFGHVSSLDLALRVKQFAEAHGLMSAEYLEELIVRRELAFNYARFTERPESFCNLPDWAKTTLRKHATDVRQPRYSPEQLERAETHDDLWNATQKEMLLRGKIHGYYRMYWGKKIIEWSETCQTALEVMIDLHDRYALDGRDPNTYTNILWCFGLHDRPWTERPIFGQIRYMSYDGMKRKTNIGAYIREIDYLERTGKELVAA